MRGRARVYSEKNLIRPKSSPPRGLKGKKRAQKFNSVSFRDMSQQTEKDVREIFSGNSKASVGMVGSCVMFEMGCGRSVGGRGWKLAG